MNEKKDDFMSSYRDLNDSMNDTGKYASWLIVGLLLGRIYQYYKTLNKRFRRWRKGK